VTKGESHGRSRLRDRRATKATGQPGAVIELEQAGDSAKAAAEADPSAAERTKELVLDAHLAICMLKASNGA
jgi:hypothetical protein